jgi:two-component SAPR family response regulator
MDIELMLQDLGCEVVGPVARLDAALELARTERLDGAILDVELQDGRAFPLADLLLGRGIPFAFATGFAENHSFSHPYDSQQRLQKPYDAEQVREVLQAFKDENSRASA